MRSYLNLLYDCKVAGVRQKNRTGKDSFLLPGGGMMQFDVAEGFPIVTTKAVPFKSVVAELIGFIRGYESAAQFRELGTKIWDANANANTAWLGNPNRRGEDDLGPVYGAQWRRWRAVTPHNHPAVFYIDQLGQALRTIINDPTSRRIIVNAWNPGELNLMALPPCHMLFQLQVEQERHRLHMTMYQRSCDMFLGIPFNISSYALLLSIIAAATGYEAGLLTMFLSDVHIYENHLAQVDEQLAREPRARPRLLINTAPFLDCSDPALALRWMESLEPAHFSLVNYDPHPAIKAEMAV